MATEELVRIVFCAAGAIVSATFLVGTIWEAITSPFERDWFHMGLAVLFLCMVFLFVTVASS